MYYNIYIYKCICSRKARARAAPAAYFTCQGILTLKIRSPDRVSGLNVSQVPFSSNVSIESSNSRERFLDFCREPERTAFSLRTVSIGDFFPRFTFFFFFFSFPCFIFSPQTLACLRAPIVYPRLLLSAGDADAVASPERGT